MGEPGGRGALTTTLSIIFIIELTLNAEALPQKRRLKDKVASLVTQHKNICDINDRDSKVHCYCENTQEVKSATKAECWVFNGGIPRDDIVWHSFTSQPTLLTLSFNVRVDGALDYVPSIALKYLPRLQRINIKYGNIATIESFAFANISTLSEIVIAQNQIEELQMFAISHLNNLTVVRLEENLLSEIRKDSFFNLPSLQNLTLSKNNISFLEDGVFSQMVNLIDLELNKNSISQLNRHTFDGLANLQRLDLRRNRLHTLNDYTFAELWNLFELHLGRNELRMITERAFDGLSQLRKLSLNDNKLKVLPSALFEGVRGLNAVDLRNNNLLSLTYKNVKPILDNLYAPKSSLFLEGNEYTCSCHLNWMFELRNQTRSPQTRQSIDAVTCRMENEQLSDYEDRTLQNISSDEGSDSMGVKKFVKGMKLLKIPIETVPCPKVKVSTTDIAPVLVQLVSVQNDIKSYKRNDFSISSSACRFHCFSGSLSICFIVYFAYFFAVG